MLKVRTVALPARTAKAAMALESMPPERKMPSGTSLTRCILTAAESCASSSFLGRGGDEAAGRRQYRRGAGNAPSIEAIAQVAAGSSSTPRTIVPGPMTKPFHT